ncbi:MAG: hypothetical protein CSA81_01970 [Acidobacteria bacterium]|nr:MAG: hypothetical protein CSA81_01970 [Acidobacteriota bacterium]
MADYPKPSLTSDAVVLTGTGHQMSVLLIERGNQPCVNQLAFPGGFANQGEPILITCLRELEEETGLKIHPHHAIPLSLRCKPGRDPRGWTVSQPFLFWLEEAKPVQGLDDARSAEWVPLSAVKTLAFDHGAILCEALGKFWHCMPTRSRKLAGIRGYLAPDPNKPCAGEITFFGGSFNPWHAGHQACLEALPADQQLIVVPDQNPLKAGPANWCYWRHYLHICKQAGEEHRVFPGFCGMEHPNPTAGWIDDTSWPKVNLLLGSDSFKNIHRWIDHEKLLNSIHTLFVVPRKGADRFFQQTSKRIQMDAKTITIKKLADHPHRELSSTALRKSTQKRA